MKNKNYNKNLVKTKDFDTDWNLADNKLEKIDETELHEENEEIHHVDADDENYEDEDYHNSLYDNDEEYINGNEIYVYDSIEEEDYKILEIFDNDTTKIGYSTKYDMLVI